MSKTLPSRDKKGIAQQVFFVRKPVRLTELEAETPRSLLVPVMENQEQTLNVMNAWLDNCSPGSVVGFTIEPESQSKKRR